nr:immunoglobulin heavy chain junction region [Mus musculus]
CTLGFITTVGPFAYW